VELTGEVNGRVLVGVCNGSLTGVKKKMRRGSSGEHCVPGVIIAWYRYLGGTNILADRL